MQRHTPPSTAIIPITIRTIGNVQSILHLESSQWVKVPQSLLLLQGPNETETSRFCLGKEEPFENKVAWFYTEYKFSYILIMMLIMTIYEEAYLVYHPGVIAI